MQSKSEKILFGGIVVFLACYFTKIFDFHNLLSVAIGAVVCAILLFKQKKFRLDIATGLLVVTVAIYFINDMDVVRTFTSHSFYEVIVMYVLAHYLVYEVMGYEKSENKIKWIIFIIAIGITIHGILNSYTFLNGQWKDGNIRVWQDFWSEEYVNGTMQVIYYLPALALTFPAIVYFKKQKICNIFIAVSSIFFIYISVISQSRMPVVIFPMVLLLQVILFALLEKESIEKFFTKKRLVILASVVLIGMIAIIAIMLSTSIGKTFISILGRDGGILNNVRFKIQHRALEQLFVYPMGGNYMDHLGYDHTHNLWLDIADIGGIIPFVTFAGYTVITAFELVKLILKKSVLTEIKVLFIGLYSAYFLFFTIEPGLNWHVYFVTPWIFLHGLIHGYVKNKS